MYGLIKIGDTTVIIEQRNFAYTDSQHVITVTDGVRPELNVTKTVIDEVSAIAVMLAFLAIDKPAPAFSELFPEHSE